MKLIIELKDETYKFFKEKLPVIIARSGGKTLTSDVYEAIKNGKPYDEADKWISVKERLPEDYGNYLVFTSDNDIDIGTYHPRYIVPQWSLCDADGFFWVEDKDIEIVKWRPLPKI